MSGRTSLEIRMQQLQQWSNSLLQRNEALSMVQRALACIPGLDVEVVRSDEHGDPEAVLSRRAAPGESLDLNTAEQIAYQRALSGNVHEVRHGSGCVTYAPIHDEHGRVKGALRWVWVST